MTVPTEYTPAWIRPEAADAAFIRLWDELAWVRHPGVPRREYYVHAADRPYAYGIAAYARTYESQPMHPELLKIWMKAEAQFGHAFETCFLNGYEDGKDFLGWHSDDSPEMDDARPILIVTFGAEREIWFRKRPELVKAEMEKFCDEYWGLGPEAYDLHAEKLAEVTRLRLGHGSLCEMKPGMQDTHQHRIPKGDREYGPRISLTFRGYVGA
jgi:alkylated DNA repair dioxygenase AlkB